jgi:hypothetical protein
VKFGAICAPAIASMLWNQHYDDDKEMILDLCDIMNAEFREVAAAGCPLIQVEEPPHHSRALMEGTTDADLEFQTMAFNRQLDGVDAEIWVHTCWGNPNQQRVHWKVPSYERGLPHLLQLKCDVLTIECASSDGRDLALFKHIKTDKKIAIGVVNHCDTVVEPAEHVAALIRTALEYIPKERLIISTDCGFGREGLSRRIRDLARRARSRQLSPDDVHGATFTITNPGQFGSMMATPVIAQPQVAILDVEAITKRPVVVTDQFGEDAIAIRPMVILGLSWDHRALDGALAARFLASVKKRVESYEL